MSIATSRVDKGSQFSEGARLLWVAMEDRGWSQGALTRALGTKSGVVSRWLYGDTKPSWDWAPKIRDLLGIPLEAWSLEPTVDFVFPAARPPAAEDAPAGAG